MLHPLAAFGKLQRFRADALSFFDELGVYRDGVAAIDFGLRRAYVIADPALAVAALLSPDLDKGRRAYGPLGTFAGFGSLRWLVGPTLPVLDGEEGLARRRHLGPVYAQVLGRFEARAAASRLTFGALGEPGGDLYPVIAAAVFERFSAVMFGRPYPQWAATISAAVSTATTALDTLSKSYVPYADRLSAAGRRLRRCRATLLDFAREVHSDLRADPADAAVTPLLDGPLSEAEVIDELLTQIVAGTETTTITTCWALSALARRPDLVTQIRGEGGRALSERCVKETLRMYPAFWTLIRVASRDLRLGALTVPRDAVLFVSPFCVHHSPAVWPDPDRFDPDRFLDRRGTPGDFIPFGYGPRACIGGRLSQRIINECVYEAAQQLELHLREDEPEGHQPDPLIVVLKSRTGFRFRAERRDL